MERRGAYRPIVVRPDHAGVSGGRPINVGAVIRTEDNLRVWMIAERWKTFDHGLKSPDRIAWLESRNRADIYPSGVRLDVYQPEPVTLAVVHDASQRRD